MLCGCFHPRNGNPSLHWAAYMSSSEKLNLEEFALEIYSFFKKLWHVT